MSKWFLIALSVTFLSAFFAILVRIEGRKEIKRIEKGELSADDFDLIEE